MRAAESPGRTALARVRFAAIAAGSLMLFRWQWLACASAYDEQYEENQRSAVGWSDSFGFLFGVVPVIGLFVVVVAAFTWALYRRAGSIRSTASAVAAAILRALAGGALLAALMCGAAFLFAEAQLGGHIFDPSSYRELYVP